MSVKLCVAPLPTPFVAVNVSGNEPGALAIPLSVAVPLWLSTKLTPAGSAPVSPRVAVGNPVVEIVKDPATPTVNVALFALELIVAALQAYVFTILSCLYLRDAIHLH